MPEASGDYLVAVLGAGGVGKSSIVQRFMTGEFSDTYVPTVEDTYCKAICCNNMKDVCNMQITDTTGSHQFPAMQRLCISRAHAFVLVYSIDKMDSFVALLPIINEIREIKGDGLEQTPICLVGNKSDCGEDSRKIKQTLGQKQANSWKGGFVETSAKNNTNITELFETLLSLEQRRNLTLQPEKETKGSKAKKKAAEKAKVDKEKADAKTAAKSSGKAKDGKDAKNKGKSKDEKEVKDKKGDKKKDKGGDDDATGDVAKKNCVVM